MSRELKRNTTPLSNVVASNPFDIPVEITNIPDGTTFTKGIITFKTRRSDEDVDTVLAVQVTSGLVVASNVLSFTISVTGSQSALFTPGILYLFDIQIHPAGGEALTPIEDGTAIFSQPTRHATS